MMRKKILDTIEKYHMLEEGAHIVIGLSGGPDSVCLFDVLCGEAEKRNWTLYPVHINHKLRPGAAEQDQAYVERLCQEKGWPCQVFVYDCNAIAKKEKITSEEAGRNVRYQSFAKAAGAIAEKGVATEKIAIAVAQNADDQAETILFRILRGAGTDGLSGIPYVRKDEQGNAVIRPLLDCFKKDILDYCKERSLAPCMDHTNEETVYTRNKIRLQLIPYLEQEYNPNIKDTMIRMGRICSSDRAFLWETAQAAYKEVIKEREGEHILLDGPGLQRLHPSIRQRVLARALEELGLEEDISSVHFAKCEEIVFHQSPSARTDLPQGYYLTKVYQDIKAVKGCAFNVDADGNETRLHISKMTIEAYNRKEKTAMPCAVFDADKMTEIYGDGFEERIVTGRRTAGDKIAIEGGRTKKIQDYFVDRKIPKDLRDHIPLVKIGNDVLWILPYQGRGRYSANFKLCEDTKNVICIELFCDL